MKKEEEEEYEDEDQEYEDDEDGDYEYEDQIMKKKNTKRKNTMRTTVRGKDCVCPDLFTRPLSGLL